MNTSNINFLAELEQIVRSRRAATAENSYTKTLFDRGTPFIAQKVGEEAVELAIAAVIGEKERTLSEAADLTYHLIVLLEASDLSLQDLAQELEARHN